MSHEDSTGPFWCNDCKAWQPCEEFLGADDGYECAVCGAEILCDICGQMWHDDHDCEAEQ